MCLLSRPRRSCGPIQPRSGPARGRRADTSQDRRRSMAGSHVRPAQSLRPSHEFVIEQPGAIQEPLVDGDQMALSMSEQPRVTFDRVLAELCRHHLAVLSTVGDDGTPHAAGVTYGAAYARSELMLFVMTRRHLRKARDIAHRPRVA